MGPWRSLRLIAVLAILPASIAPVFGQEEPGTRAPYVVVHGWPQLPSDFALGMIPGVGVDSHNHVFVFNRAENSFLCIGEEAACPSPAPTWQPSPIASPTILSFDGITGKQLAAWGQNRFVNPHGLAVDHHDNVWVTDNSLHQVFEFSNDGQLLLTLGTARTPGLDGTHFNSPTAIAFAPDDSVYVSDGYGNSRVAKFSHSGKFLLDWGHKGSGPGEFDTPHGVAVDKQGLVYVADRENSRIQVFDPNGKFLRMWKYDDMGKPWDVAVGPDNLLYVVYGGNGIFTKAAGHEELVKFDRTGKILARWSRFGNYDGEIYWGHGIAVGPDGAVYVGDVNRGMRVQKFVPRQ
jgi:peptidylamidoglycolate lyase